MMIKFRELLQEIDFWNFSLVKSDVLNEIRFKRYIISIHVIKLVISDNSYQARNHWIDELYAFFESIAGLQTKNRNRIINVKDYYSILFLDTFVHKDVFDYNLVNKEIIKFVNNKPTIPLKDNLEQISIEDNIQKFYEEICILLSVKNKFTKQILQQLVNKYL